MELAKYKACICEGAAENAIMDILLDYGLLIFSREEMIEEEVIRCRAYKKFMVNYPMYVVGVKLCAFSPREMT
ncbi:MAG: hypothetical protein J6A11_02270 [Lachnospiraceae bacterium]|nr:hypothetical protein [Lachnospiraceae bacterium]